MIGSRSRRTPAKMGEEEDRVGVEEKKQDNMGKKEGGKVVETPALNGVLSAAARAASSRVFMGGV